MSAGVYKKRRADFATWMARESIALVMFADSERQRSPSVRYFTGHPCDAVLFLTVTGESVLCPWDENLAARCADAEKIIPYTDFRMDPVEACKCVAVLLGTPARSNIEIPGTTSYPEFLSYVDALRDFDVICRTGGAGQALADMRMIKDGDEIAQIRKACGIADAIAAMIEKKVRAGQLKTETDVALFIEKEARKAGAEGTSFETLAAGASRSQMIHAFPASGSGVFGGPGLSILDFGVKYQGYASDKTLTFVSGSLTAPQEKMIAAVEKAYAESLPLYHPGKPVREAAQKADDVFSRIRCKMPHGLGHGIGLEIHEAPFVRSRLSGADGTVFQPGMVVTLEPGLYSAKEGGVRLENDILITETGNEVLTDSRIVYL